MINQLCAILALCLLCTATTKSRAIEYFSNQNAVTLSPQQTAESLKSEIISLIGRRDEVSKFKLGHLNRLMSFAEVSDCSAASFESLNSLIGHPPIDTKTRWANIVNLLKHQRQQLFETCKPKFESDLSAAVDRLSTSVEKIERAKAFTDKVMSISHGELYYPNSVLTKAVKDFIRQEKPVGSRLSFEQAVRKCIMEPCSAVNKELDAITKIYRGFDPEMIAQLSNFERNWILVDYVCRDALTRNMTHTKMN